MKLLFAHSRLSLVLDACIGLQFVRINPLKNRRYSPSPLRSITPSNPDVPRFAIEKHYNKTMCKNNAPLFRDCATYCESLPARDFGDNFVKPVKLCDLPFWVDKDEITEMVEDLEITIWARGVVRYVVAPTKAGKTASILPAFLESTKNEDGYQHYIYMACDNNNQRHFKMRGEAVALDIDAAEKQGALFMFESLKLLFNANFATHILDLDGLTVPKCDETLASLTQYIQEAIPGNQRILIHIDEHHMMCDLDTPQAAAFRRGAMQVLCAVPRVTALATLTGIPYEIAPFTSSSIIRNPIRLASLDIEKLMMAVKELNFTARHDPADFTIQEKGLWGTLKFRLALKLKYGANKDLGLIDIQSHLLGDSSPEAISFLNDFYDTFTKAPSTEEALVKCCNLVALPALTMSENVAAFDLLLGVLDDDDIARKGKNLTLYKVGGYTRLTEDLLTLLSSDDPNYPIYSVGRDRLAKALRDAVNLDNNFLSSTPLKASYAWILSCQSAYCSNLHFGLESKNFRFKCSSLKAGRIFPADDANEYTDFSALEENTIYFVDEDKGNVNHPLCDVFLCTAKKEVLMIDITGSLSDRTAKDKASKLRDWIKAEQPKPKNSVYKLNGLVLAPFIDSASTSGDSVTIVRGVEAQSLLGGLWQIATYFESEY